VFHCRNVQKAKVDNIYHIFGRLDFFFLDGHSSRTLHLVIAQGNRAMVFRCVDEAAADTRSLDSSSNVHHLNRLMKALLPTPDDPMTAIFTVCSIVMYADTTKAKRQFVKK